MNSAQQHRQRQRIDDLCAAVLRAATGRAQLHFEAGRLYDDARPVPVRAPHLRVEPREDGLAARRGVADAVALRLRCSDPALHAGLMPADPVARLVFEWLEQLRVESLVPDELPGMRANLERRYRDWSAGFFASGSAETGLGVLLFSLSQIVWSRLTSRALPDEIADFLEPTRAALAPALGTALAGIRRHRGDQLRFAEHALVIAQEMAQRVRMELEDSPETGRGRPGALMLDLEFDQDDTVAFPPVQTAASPAYHALGGQYRVFTTRYDQECEAVDLVRAAVLRDYRDRLDQRIARQGVNLPRLVRALRAAMATPRRDGWLFGQEEGAVDGRRLAQLVSSPGERRLFRLDRSVPVADAAATLLIDCSGSMRAGIESVAVMADVMMRALEQAGVPTEVLGFTTVSWNGGRARQDWLSAGRPGLPGRLNEIRHLVFKSDRTSWRRARRPLAALLKSDLFREGVDGEAVDWACARLLQRDAARRLLVVFSDGCPMDSATNQANDDFYLDNHLKAVVARNVRQHGIDICGVGVGLDLGAYYPRSLAVDLEQGLDNRVFDELVRLLAGRRRP